MPGRNQTFNQTEKEGRNMEPYRDQRLEPIRDLLLQVPRRARDNLAEAVKSQAAIKLQHQLAHLVSPPPVLVGNDCRFRMRFINFAVEQVLDCHRAHGLDAAQRHLNVVVAAIEALLDECAAKDGYFAEDRDACFILRNWRRIDSDCNQRT